MPRAVASLFLIPILVSCASVRMQDRESNRLFRSGEYEAAGDRLSDKLKKIGEGHRDELLFLMDIGLSYQLAGYYEESNQALLKADKIAEIKDYTSLAEELSTTVVSDNTKPYKGEHFEKVLINVYLALNYLALGEYEDALVEAKRVNRKLARMNEEGKKTYELNAFAHYLSGVIYEMMGEPDNAYIDYKKAYAIEADHSGLALDLYRVAKQLRFEDDAKKWKDDYSLTAEDEEEARHFLPRSGYGQLMVVFQNGIGPRKRPHPNWSSIPKFYPRHNPVDFAEVEIDGKVVMDTEPLHDVETAAIRNLDDKYGAIIAKKVAGVVAKEAVGYGVAKATDSPLLGFITKVALHAADQADVRSWNLLPKDLQTARLALKPGEYTVKLLPNGDEPMEERKVTIVPGRVVWLNLRYMP